VTLYDRAKTALVGAGLTVERYGEHVGQAYTSYVAIYDGGVIPKSRATGYRIIGVAAYAPRGKREEIEPMLVAAGAALKAIKMTSRGSPSAEGFDDAFKAHFQTIEYVAPCAM
jgi:hypothetical protein